MEVDLEVQRSSRERTLEMGPELPVGETEAPADRHVSERYRANTRRTRTLFPVLGSGGYCGIRRACDRFKLFMTSQRR